MKTTWIITSAINTNAGIYDVGARILQTHDTINSILRFYPDALLVLVEGGRPMQDSPAWDTLRKRVNVYMDLTGNPQIQHLHENFLSAAQNRNEMGGLTGLSKTVAEITTLGSALNSMLTDEQLRPLCEVDRVFKISGRYQLSPMFDASVYTMPEAADRFVFHERQPSWIADALNTVGTAYGYNSRFWSLPASRLEYLREVWDIMGEDALEITKTRYIDMEHLLFKHIGPDQSLELEHVHVMGTIAPTGTMIYD